MVVVAPTTKLASDDRAMCPHLDVDTIHGAFLLHGPEQETLDLVVVEEFGQCHVYNLERVVRLCCAVNQQPALVFLGDFSQLPGVPAVIADTARSLCKRAIQSKRCIKRC